MLPQAPISGSILFDIGRLQLMVEAMAQAVRAASRQEIIGDQAIPESPLCRGHA
jgi:hypothetical protein